MRTFSHFSNSVILPVVIIHSSQLKKKKSKRDFLLSLCILSLPSQPPTYISFFLGDIILLTKPVTLTEGDRVTLTTDVLMATDGTGKPEKLLYAVSVPPVPGQIESINYLGCPIPCTASQMDWPRRFAVCMTIGKGLVRKQSGERVSFFPSPTFPTTTPHPHSLMYLMSSVSPKD